MSQASAVIFGNSGTELTQEERDFFRDADPWGFIVFARNIEDPKQLARLTMSMRDCVGRDAPVFVDQEGGRVARLRPPAWRDVLPAQVFGDLYLLDPEAAIEATRINHQLMGRELRSVGLDADCAPVLDLRIDGADGIIGDRAFGTTPEPIIALGRAAMDGLMQAGVAPIIKHIPGHGRADVDSHLLLPRVRESVDCLTETDFAPFKALADAPMAMTAHIVYEAIDPDRPATTSAEMVGTVIRSSIGFDGLLMTDDLSMKALDGSFRERGEAAISVGCDLLLHCNGDMAEMLQIAEATPSLEGKAFERAEKAEAARDKGEAFDPKAAESRLNALLR